MNKNWKGKKDRVNLMNDLEDVLKVSHSLCAGWVLNSMFQPFSHSYL